MLVMALERKELMLNTYMNEARLYNWFNTFNLTTTGQYSF